MEIRSLFESWRTAHRCEDGWGLAWYLAYEFCTRYFSSHGIVPHVIEHEGLGYYGIQLDYVRCSINPYSDTALGRLTMCGDVENWRTGGPGDHGLETTKLCDRGDRLDDIVAAGIRHMGFPVTPAKSHLSCRHKRWGKSYELMFAIAASIAIRNDYGKLRIWNHPCHTDQVVRDLDPQAGMNEHMGAFLLRADRQVLITGDGRLLGGNDTNYWQRYMQGESPYTLSLEIEAMLEA